MVFSAMSPWLLAGYLLAGATAFFLKPDQVKKHLGGTGIMPILKAVFIGIPLPVCSCGIIPIATALRDEGAEKGAVGAFFISTPQTGIDSIIVTASMMGWPIALLRPVIAFLSGLTGGLLISKFACEEHRAAPAAEKKCCCCCCHGGKKAEEKSKTDPLKFILSYGFIRMLKSTAPSLLLGMLIAALIQQLVPADFGAEYLCGNTFLEFAAILIFSIPLYVCSNASVPIALTLMLKGFSPGAALLFLVAGPAIHSVSITSMYKIIGTRATVIAVAVLGFWAVAAGVLANLCGLTVNLNQLFLRSVSGGGTLKNLCGILLALLLCRALAVRAAEKFRKKA